MKRKYLLLLSLCLLILIPLSRVGAIDDEIKKNGGFHSQLQHIQSATYTVLAFSFYTHPADESYGKIVGGRGRGFFGKFNTDLLFLSNKHVLYFDELVSADFGPLNLPLKRFGEPWILAFSDYNDAQVATKLFFKYLNKKKLDGGWNWVKDYEEATKKFKKIFDKAIRLDHKKLVYAHRNNPTQEAAYIKVDAKYADKIHYLTREFIADRVSLRFGQAVALWGCPNQLGEYYREGIISNPFWTDPDSFIPIGESGELLTYYEYGVTDIIVAPGDSGSPVLASIEGQLKVIGVLTMTFQKSPRLGVFYKMDSFLDALDL